MRWITVVVVLLPLLARAELVDATTDRELCRAAMLDSGLPERVNSLLEDGRLAFSDAPALLELECNGRTLLRTLVEERRAENLEYVVIDLGVSLDQRVTTEAGEKTLARWLAHQSREHERAPVRDFARTYLERLGDSSFNPNLLVSAD